LRDRSHVSVPWRGLRSFGRFGRGCLRPPPTCFRPLAGITVFRTQPSRYCPLVAREVSVPWRGLRSFGLPQKTFCSFCWLWVSVPWRGLRSFGPGLCRRDLIQRDPVSVPWRGLRSFGQIRNSADLGKTISFRPLAGIRVFRTKTTLRR